MHWISILALCVAALAACGDDADTTPEDDVGEVDAKAPTDAGSDGGKSIDAGRQESALDSGGLIDAMLQVPATDAAQPVPVDAKVIEAPPTGQDLTASLYATDQVLDVQIALSPADWDTLRGEGRSLNDVFSGCQDDDFEYTMMHASVSIGGESFQDVGLRKKGFLGSISVRKPSLRVELDQFVAGQTVRGAKTLTLNNSLSDPSYTRQCMAYDAFRAAGVAAPRCSFARVTVNGQLLGMYVNVEPIKKPFLKRVFREDKGNLYEGSSPADFRTDMLANFEKKTNETEPGKPELEALAALLLKSDDELLAGLHALLDVDQFFLFWATESLIAHWDSYSGDLNNFYVYADPDTKRLRFIPWGTDGAYERQPFLLGNAPRPQSVYALGRLSRRLYQIAETRERYRKTLRDLLATRWDESALLKEIDRIASLLGGAARTEALDTQRDFVRTRRAQLDAELLVEAPAWTLPERALAVCSPELVMPITGNFRATWGSAATPAAENTLTLAGQLQMPLVALASAAPSTTVSTLPNSLLTLSLVQPNGSLLVVQYVIGRDTLSPGAYGMHGFETLGVVLSGPNAMGLQAIGFVGDGSITFSEAATTMTAPVAGTFSGKLVGFAPAPAAMMP